MNDIMDFNLLMNICFTLFFGIISGAIAAFIFYYLMRSIKPKIEISSEIAKEVKTDENGKQIFDNDGNPVYEYVLKFINYTKSSIEDVSYQLFIMEDYFHGSGKNFQTRELEFNKTNKTKYIVGVKDKDHSIDDNCRQIVIKGNLEEDWDKNREWLEFQIVSYHSKSGSRKVHKKKYTDRRSCIVEGYFDTGHTLEIIKN